MARRLATVHEAGGENESTIYAGFADLIDRLDQAQGQGSPALNASVEDWAGHLANRGISAEMGDDLAAASNLFERAQKLLATYLGREHYLTRSARCTLERSRILERSAPEARRAVQESFVLRDRCGKLTSSGKPEEALGLARPALASRVKVLGEPSREVGFCHDAIGKLKENTNRFVDAEFHYREALAQYTPVLGKLHPDGAEVWTNLGKLSLITNRSDIARQAFGGALGTCRSGTRSRWPGPAPER